MSITQFFDNTLDAPLVNQLWSWGAVTRDGKRLALRVWAHETLARDGNGKRWVAIDWPMRPAEQLSAGAPERTSHVALLRAGMPTVGVMCTAIATTNVVKKIESFDRERLFVFDPEVVEMEGLLWASYSRIIQPREFKALVANS